MLSNHWEYTGDHPVAFITWVGNIIVGEANNIE